MVATSTTCAHQTAPEVEARWLDPRLEGHELAPCECCRGPSVVKEWRTVAIAYLVSPGEYASQEVRWAADGMCSRCEG